MAGKLAEMFVDITGNANPLFGTLNAVKGALGKIGGLKVGLGGLAGLAGLAGVGGALGYAVKQAGDLEKAYSQIRKTTGLTGEEFAQLKGKLQGLATSMAGVSLDEINGIAAMAGRLGIEGVGGITEFTKSIAMIRIALDDIPAEEAATSIARILNVMGLGPEAALSFASALNKLDDTSTATGRDILDVTQRLSGAAAALGMAPQQVLALAAALKDAGVENEVAGSAFTQILAKMATDTKAFAKVAGVGTREFADAIKNDPLQAIKLLVAGLNGMSKLEKFKALDGLGLDGVRTAGSLLQLSTVIDKLDGNVAAANGEWDSHASILKEVAIQGETTWAQLDKMWNNVRLGAAAIGDLMLPALKQLAGLAAEAAGGLSELVKSSQGEVLPWVATISGAIDSLGLVFRNFGTIVALAWLDVLDQFDMLGEWLGSFVGWLGDEWQNLFRDVFVGLVVIIENFVLNAVHVLKELWDYIASFGKDPIRIELRMDRVTGTFKTTGFTAPEFKSSREGERAALLDGIAGRESDRDKARAAVDATRDSSSPDYKKKGAKPDGTGKAPEADQKVRTESLDAYAKRLQEGIFGGKKKTDKAIEDTAKNTGDAVTQLGIVVGKLATLITKPGGPGFATGP